MNLIPVIIKIVFAAMMLVAASQNNLEATIAFGIILITFKED